MAASGQVDFAGLRVGILFGRPAVGGMPWRASMLARAIRQRGGNAALFYTERNGDVPHYLADVSEPDLAAWQPNVIISGWPSVPSAAVFSVAPVCVWVGGPAAVPIIAQHPRRHLVARYICVDPSLVYLMPEDLQGRCVPIRNAINPTQYRYDPATGAKSRQFLGLNGGPTVLWAGRLGDAQKGPDALGEVVGRTLDRMQWLIVGSHTGTPPDWLVGKVGHPKLRWLPDLQPPQVVPMYHACTHYLSTSRAEGLSVAALEAALTGAACVLTDVGGSVQVTAASGGELVQPGDVDGMVWALTRAIVRPVEQRRLVGDAVARAFPFDAYLAEYAQVLKGVAQ